MILPFYLVDSLRTYKRNTTAFLTWLATSGRRCGYDLSSLSTSGSSSSIRKTTQDVTQTQDEPQTLILDLKHILPLAEKVAVAPRKLSRLPVSVAEALQRAIKDRERCNVWFERHQGDDVEAKRANDGHAYFISVLKQALSTLETKADLEVSSLASNVSLQTECGTPTVTSLFEHLAMEDILDEEATVLRATEAPALQASITNSKHKNESAEPIYTVKEAEEDPPMALFCLLEDLARLRAFIRETWESRKAKKITSVAASLVTHSALDFAKALEMNSLAASGTIDGWDEAVQMLEGRLLDCSTQKANSGPTKHPFLELKNILIQFCDLEAEQFQDYIDKYISGYARPKPLDLKGSFDTEDPIHLGLLPLYKALIEAGQPCGSDLLSAGLAAVLSTRKIDLWTVFTLQTFCDTRHVLGQDAANGFEDFQTTAMRLQRITDNYYRYSERMLPPLEGVFADNMRQLHESSNVYLNAGRGDDLEDKAMLVMYNHPFAHGIEDALTILGAFQSRRGARGTERARGREGVGGRKGRTERATGRKAAASTSAVGNSKKAERKGGTRGREAAESRRKTGGERETEGKERAKK